MLKTAFSNSFLYKIVTFASVVYSNSKTNAVLDKLSYYAGESIIGKRYNKFKNRRPYVAYSRYQGALNKISAWISKITEPLNVFFTRLVNGSAFCTAYFGFLNNRQENRMRAAGLFGFYFCLAAVLISIATGISRGIGIGWGGRVIPVFIAGMAFFALAFFSRRLSVIFKNSFFIKLLADLLK